MTIIYTRNFHLIQHFSEVKNIFFQIIHSLFEVLIIKKHDSCQYSHNHHHHQHYHQYQCHRQWFCLLIFIIILDPTTNNKVVFLLHFVSTVNNFLSATEFLGPILWLTPSMGLCWARQRWLSWWKKLVTGELFCSDWIPICLSVRMRKAHLINISYAGHTPSTIWSAEIFCCPQKKYKKVFCLLFKQLAFLQCNTLTNTQCRKS